VSPVVESMIFLFSNTSILHKFAKVFH